MCLGLPGALPVLNRRAVELATRAALAIGCEVHPRSIFARKNYFYPDLPKGYQISQYDQPLATGGAIVFTAGGRAVRVGLTRIHMEEDAGKSLHEGYADSARSTHLDFNRAGVPLIEIVTEPDLRSAADAAEAFSRVREMLVAIGVNDGNMEEGSLRCDANVSVRPEGRARVRRQDRAEEPQLVPPREEARSSSRSSATSRRDRSGDADRAGDAALRSGHRAHDRDADQGRSRRLPVLPRAGSAAAGRRRRVDRVDSPASCPSFPEARRARFVAQYQLPEYDAGVLTQSMALADYFERVAAAAGNAKAASNWVMGELTRKLNETRGAIEQAPLAPDALGELIALIDQGAITGPVAKERVREDVRIGPARRRDRRSRGTRAHRRSGRHRSHRSATCSPLTRRPWRSTAPARRKTFGFLVGPGDEGDGRQGRSRRASTRRSAATWAIRRGSARDRSAEGLEDVQPRRVCAARAVAAIDKGEFVFLTGPSGAGKSTLLRLLLRQEIPTEGRLVVGGRDLSRLSVRQVQAYRRSLGFVFQDFKLLPNKTVLDNVAFVPRVLGMAPTLQQRRTFQVLKWVGLQHRMNAFPLELSGGEQQRIAIARALVNDPVIIIADEPTGNLDPDLSLEIMNLFREINARGTTVVVATHDRELIRRVGRRTLSLDHGSIVEVA